jgi:hypothetical protein
MAIKGFEGLYEICEDGQVFSIVQTNSRRIRALKPWGNGIGYLKVNLYKDGKQHKRYVHRLVAEAFISNPENKPNVNHRDCNLRNNRADNLEWCTQSENILHAVKLGRHVDNISKYNRKEGDAKCQ